MQAETNITLSAPTGQTPINNLHTAIDNTIHQLLGYKAQLWRAQEAGLTTVNLEDPDSGKLYRVGIDLAIDAIEFAVNVKKVGEL